MNIRATAHSLLLAEFARLAAQLGAREMVDARDPVASVHAVLARFPAPWLLIFDNAADMASVAAFLPPAGPGRVLITSQNPNWPSRPLHVPELDVDIAADFLVNRTGDRGHRRDPLRHSAGQHAGLGVVAETAAAQATQARRGRAG